MPAEHCSLTFEWLGHASVRITARDGTVVYIDPWSEVFDERPGDGDIVLITHDDKDHYDTAAIDAVLAPEGTLAVFDGVDTGSLSVPIIDLPLAGTTTVGGFEVQTIPAYNDPEGPHVDENGDPFHAEGEVTGVLFTLDRTTVYYPSDTDFLPHHESVSADVFIPPIGGHFTMDRHEATDFARSVDPELVLPVHYDTFEAVETDAEAFVTELREDGIETVLF